MRVSARGNGAMMGVLWPSTQLRSRPGERHFDVRRVRVGNIRLVRGPHSYYALVWIDLEQTPGVVLSLTRRDGGDGLSHAQLPILPHHWRTAWAHVPQGNDVSLSEQSSITKVARLVEQKNTGTSIYYAFLGHSGHSVHDAANASRLSIRPPSISFTVIRSRAWSRE